MYYGVRGISAASGVTCQVPEEAAINQLLIQHTSKQVIVLLTVERIGVRDSFSSSDIRSIDYLITDSNANPAQLSKIEAAGVKVQLVDPWLILGESRIKAYGFPIPVAA